MNTQKAAIIRLRDWRVLREWEAFKAAPTVAQCRGTPDPEELDDDLDEPVCNDLAGLPPPVSEPVVDALLIRLEPARGRGRRRR